jgi:hypothetical protein
MSFTTVLYVELCVLLYIVNLRADNLKVLLTELQTIKTIIHCYTEVGESIFFF